MDNKYPHIPKRKKEIFKSQTEQFCKIANEYFKKAAILQDEIYKLEDKKELLLKTKKDHYEDFIKQCPHKYIAEPRQYQSSQEWRCSICGHQL